MGLGIDTAYNRIFTHLKLWCPKFERLGSVCFIPNSNALVHLWHSTRSFQESFQIHTDPIKICYCEILTRSWSDLPQNSAKIHYDRSWQDLSTTLQIYSEVEQPDQSWEDPWRSSPRIWGRSYQPVPSRILNRILYEPENNLENGFLQV